MRWTPIFTSFRGFLVLVIVFVLVITTRKNLFSNFRNEMSSLNTKNDVGRRAMAKFKNHTQTKLVKHVKTITEKNDTDNSFYAHLVKRDTVEFDAANMRVYNVGVLMASHLDSPFDLERCGPAVDLALDVINRKFLQPHNITLQKVQASYPSCSGAKAPGLAADMHFKDNVIAFIGPACAFALEPVARLAAYWNSPIITGMGDQPPSEEELTVTSGILGKIHKWKNESTASLLNDPNCY